MKLILRKYVSIPRRCIITFQILLALVVNTIINISLLNIVIKVYHKNSHSKKNYVSNQLLYFYVILFFGYWK